MLSGCSSEQKQSADTPKEGEVVNIYCWNTEFKNLYEAYAADLAKSHGVDVNFVVITNDHSAYQTNLDEALAEQNEVIDDDKVDIFLVEADYASKYVKSDNTLETHLPTVTQKQKLEMEFTEIMQYAKVRSRTSGAEHGFVQQKKRIIFHLLRT